MTAGNLSNQTFQFFGTDTLRSNVTFSWNGTSDTASYTMTVSGTVFPISAGASVQTLNFTELMTPISVPLPIGAYSAQAAQAINTAGGRGILVDGGPGPNGGKGSRTDYNGSPIVPTERRVTGMTSTYSSGAGTLSIACSNTMITATPLPMASREVTAGMALVMGSLLVASQVAGVRKA